MRVSDYPMPTKQERTGWRDEKLSQRHRLWGYDCPALDIDFLMIEYNKGKAVALIEYKNEHAALQYAKHPSYKALIDLGNRAEMPVFAVRYADTFAWFKVTGLNEWAKPYQMSRKEMNELNFVSFLYDLRGLVLPVAVKKLLSSGK